MEPEFIPSTKALLVEVRRFQASSAERDVHSFTSPRKTRVLPSTSPHEHVLSASTRHEDSSPVHFTTLLGYASPDFNDVRRHNNGSSNAPGVNLTSDAGIGGVVVPVVRSMSGIEGAAISATFQGLSGVSTRKVLRGAQLQAAAAPTSAEGGASTGCSHDGSGQTSGVALHAEAAPLNVEEVDTTLKLSDRGSGVATSEILVGESQHAQGAPMVGEGGGSSGSLIVPRNDVNRDEALASVLHVQPAVMPSEGGAASVSLNISRGKASGGDLQTDAALNPEESGACSRSSQDGDSHVTPDETLGELLHVVAALRHGEGDASSVLSLHEASRDVSTPQGVRGVLHETGAAPIDAATSGFGGVLQAASPPTEDEREPREGVARVLWRAEDVTQMLRYVERTASAWKIGEVSYAGKFSKPPDFYTTCLALRHAILDECGVPRHWAVHFSSHASGCSEKTATVSTGRLDLEFPRDATRHGLPGHVSEHLTTLECSLPQILMLAGFSIEAVKNFRLSQTLLKVNFLRCERTPFVLPRETSSLPFGSVVVLVPLFECDPIAFWDQKALHARDGTPVSYIPSLTERDVVVFTETPYSLLSTLWAQRPLVTSAFFLFHVYVNGASVSTSTISARSAMPTQIWNVGPEEWLQTATTQPPVTTCCICRGYIRERRHGDLTGFGCRDLDRDHGCTGFHCTTCRQQKPHGPFMVCEFCSRVVRIELPSIDDKNFANPVNDDVVSAACQHMISPSTICVHNTFNKNDIIDTLFLLIKPSEIMAAAASFRDFTLKGSWIADLLPDNVAELISLDENDKLWPAFYQVFYLNAHCPRVVAVCYAIQCALDTGPLLATRRKQKPLERELYFAGPMSSYWNERGMRECVRDRVILSCELASGFFGRDALMKMAVRVFRLFSVSKFQHNFQCSCSGGATNTERPHASKSCNGPVLDLSKDKGQDHIWPTLSAELRSRTESNLRRLRTFQADLALEMENYPIQFDGRRHIKCPNA